MSEHDVQSMFFEAALYLKHPALRWMHAIPNGGARNVAEWIGKRIKQSELKEQE